MQQLQGTAALRPPQAAAATGAVRGGVLALRHPATTQGARRPLTRLCAASAPEREVKDLSLGLPSLDDKDLAPEPVIRPFAYPLPLEQQQAALAGIPLPLFYPGLLAVMGVAGFVGLQFGRAAPVEPENKDTSGYAVAAVGVVAGAALAVQAKKKRDSAAAVALYNKIVELPDPSELSAEIVKQVGGKFGVNVCQADLEGVQKIYSQYLESLIPTGDQQLTGDEVGKVSAFKAALGLTDEQAAPVHQDVARKLFAKGYETKDRNQQFEQRKAFQRLIYVSQLMFGDQKAAVLLPWREMFNITDAQVFVARRDNARAIFRAYLERQGGDLRVDREFLQSLRQHQLAVKLMDETAEEVVREASRKQVEALLEKSIAVLRATAKTRDPDLVLGPVQEAISYSRQLAACAGEEGIIPGTGAVTLRGGALAHEGRQRDLRDLYRAFLKERMKRSQAFDNDLEADAQHLQAMLCLIGPVAQGLQDEAAAGLYKKLLKAEVAAGRLDQAEAPAQVLGELCDRVRFSPEAAMELHKGLYRLKLSALVSEGRALSAADTQDLARIRHILCLPQEVARKVQRETVGKVLADALNGVYELGVRPVTDAELARLDKIQKDLQLEQDVALEVFKDVTRGRLQAYVREALKERAQKQQDRQAVAAAIKKAIQFNAVVVTPLLERIKGSAQDAAAKELAEIMAKAMEAAQAAGNAPPPVVTPDAATVSATMAETSSRPPPFSTPAAPATIDTTITAGNPTAAPAAAPAASTSEPGRAEALAAVQKAMAAKRGEFGEQESKGQKEITLKDDVTPENRAALYKEFMMSVMMGDVVELPVGGMVRKRGNQGARSNDMARLQALADLLGMNQMEVMGVQSDMTEQAFKGQAQEVMRSGPWSEEKAQHLEDMRTQLGLSKDKGDAALKAVRTDVYGHATSPEDKWTIERIAEVTKSGGSLEGRVEEVTRRNLFRREFEKAISDGTGDLNPTYLLDELPKMLNLEERKVKQIAKELAGSKRRMLLVQAISQLRQRRTSETTESLLNLLSATRTLPGSEATMSWTERGEVRDVYALFCAKVNDEDKRQELAQVLGLTAEELSSVHGASSSAAAAVVPDEDPIF